MDVFVLLICVAIGAFLVRAIRNLFSRTDTPSRIHLVVIEATGSHARDLETHAPRLQASGFDRVGTYRVEPLRGVIATAFVHPLESLCAVVYSHPMVGCFVDMIHTGEDGRSVTVTTAPVGGVLDPSENHERIVDPLLTVPAMLDLVRERRPPGRPREWTADNFSTRFEAAYAEEMDGYAGGRDGEPCSRDTDASDTGDGNPDTAAHELHEMLVEPRGDSS